MIYVIDSTPLKVCINLRIPHHKVFRGVAGEGKAQQDGFLASSYTLLSITSENLWL
jgi:hypothetical protein